MLQRRALAPLALAIALLVAPGLAQAAEAPAAPAAAQGILAGSDPSVRPQDDFFRHAHGRWLANTEIPADRTSVGAFRDLREDVNAEVKAMLEALAAKGNLQGEDKLVGDFYAAMLDREGQAKAGLKPLLPTLARIEGLKSHDELSALWGEQLVAGVGSPVGAWVMPDADQPTVNTVVWWQGGLGMPDRETYLKGDEAAQKLRFAYRDYAAKLLVLAGKPEAEAQAAAVQILGLEKAIAQLQWPAAKRRDPKATHNPFTRAQLASAFPGLDVAAFAKAVGMPANAGATVGMPDYVKGVAQLMRQVPLSTWKAYHCVRALDAYAEAMGPAFREAHFNFHGRKLEGLQAEQPTWKWALRQTDEAVGESVGRAYAAKHFPAEAKARILSLVANLRAAYHEALGGASWMAPATRKAAQDKLAALGVKVGYPDRWRGHAGLVVRRDDAVGNLMRAAAFHYGRDMAEAGQPVDRTRWHMNAHTVNAYFDPTANEIAFPAGILRPPFFDAKGDDARNYGGIGAVIGHEIGHGFDDSGRQYDGQGRLRDWWTPADAAAYQVKADAVASQYERYEPLPGLHLNGKLTLGENLADLTGCGVAFAAYQRSLGGRPAPVIEGLTGQQRFFYGYAGVWRGKDRPEYLRTKVAVDPHSPGEFRVNGVLTNLDAFHEAFGLQPGDRLYRSPAERLRVW